MRSSPGEHRLRSRLRGARVARPAAAGDAGAARGRPAHAAGADAAAGDGDHRRPRRLPARAHGLPVVHRHQPGQPDLRRQRLGRALELQGGVHRRAPAHFTREHRRLRVRVRDRHDGLRVRGGAAAQRAPEGQLRVLHRRAAAVGGARDRRRRDLEVAVRPQLRVRQLGAGQPRLRLLPGLRLVRQPLLGLRRDLHHRLLAVVPVHRAEPARRPADAAPGDASGRVRRRRELVAALPAGDAAAAAADRRRAGGLLHHLGLQDLRPDLRDGGRRAGPQRRHRRRRRLPRGLRALALRARQRGRRRAVPDPAPLLDPVRAADREGGRAVMRWLRRRGWKYGAMIVVSAFALFPVYYLLITSLKTREEIYSRTPDLWPNHPNWHEYTSVLGEGHVGRALVNSLIVASGTMVICLIVGALAAYALARWRFKITHLLLMAVLMTQMFPLVVLVIPLFVIMRKADLLGTYWSLIITYLAFSIPLAIWVMRSFILTIPEELEYAARIDGATRIGAMVRVVLPLAAPGLATVAVLAFLEGWKEFLLALTFLNDENKKTMPLVLQSFVGRGDVDWAKVMATSVLYTLPVAIVFVLARKHLMTARTGGAVKGWGSELRPHWSTASGSPATSRSRTAASRRSGCPTAA